MLYLNREDTKNKIVHQMGKKNTRINTSKPTCFCQIIKCKCIIGKTMGTGKTYTYRFNKNITGITRKRTTHFRLSAHFISKKSTSNKGFETDNPVVMNTAISAG